MDAVNKILGREIPATNTIPADTIAPADAQANISTSQTETGKKNGSDCG